MMDKQQTAADEKQTAAIGKFNTAEDLLSAYNALESEFTKRCQLIKKLQTELEDLRAQAYGGTSRYDVNAVAPPQVEIADTDKATDGGNAECVADSAEEADDSRDLPVERSTIEANGAHAPEISGQADAGARGIEYVLKTVAENAADCAELLADIPEIMAACISRYKHRLIGARRCTVAPDGAAVLVPAKRPATLADAKRLADELLASE